MPFIPHTEQDVREMLAVIGAPGIEALFDEIPAALRVPSLAEVPAGLSEFEVMQLMQSRARQDGRPLCFIGAGAYEHHIPAAVWSTVTRGEFYSAYTPYQAEASQGTLQSIYEYQTMLASLTGMEVCNASMYEGATALAEAVLMAVRANRRSKSARILMPRNLHPHYRAVALATTGNQGVRFEELPYERALGHTLPSSLAPFAGQDITALVIAQPNFFGVFEEVDALTDFAHAQGAFVIAVVNPTSLALLKPPGSWGQKGANIAVGEGQPLGCPLSSGGPYFGFMCTRMEHVRQMPGRLVGRTLDLDGRPGFTLTLQAREQHIRRAKATSNICTNQGLLMLAGTLYLALLGPEGLERVAAVSMQRTEQLARALTAIAGVRRVFGRPGFHEIVLALDRPAAPVLAALSERGIEGGLDLGKDYPELGPALLACATETKSAEDIETYARALAEVLRPARAA
ncbi:MAG TPA: aminomethyl-transferring glycine dehydrogenase subunit GcvPA [Steroidobacteraceae bacterium]|jgi:glycine dehydrogenase subunit 1|nr:aminomethyl-transferring glycine dehydrogenase subunit GcvPA [Steroidobacteraceae bacterium]